MTPELQLRVRSALGKLDAAAEYEGIEPGSYLGAWCASNRDLVEALLALEQFRERQLQEIARTALDATQTAAETVRQQVEVLRIETRRIDRFIEQARLTLGEKESATVQALADEIGNRFSDANFIRAKAWSRSNYLRSAALVVGLCLGSMAFGLEIGVRLHDNGAPEDFAQQCVASMRHDATSGRTFCAVEVVPR